MKGSNIASILNAHKDFVLWKVESLSHRWKTRTIKLSAFRFCYIYIHASINYSSEIQITQFNIISTPLLPLKTVMLFATQDGHYSDKLPLLATVTILSSNNAGSKTIPEVVNVFPYATVWLQSIIDKPPEFQTSDSEISNNSILSIFSFSLFSHIQSSAAWRCVTLTLEKEIQLNINQSIVRIWLQNFLSP